MVGIVATDVIAIAVAVVVPVLGDVARESIRCRIEHNHRGVLCDVDACRVRIIGHRHRDLMRCVGVILRRGLTEMLCSKTSEAPTAACRLRTKIPEPIFSDLNRSIWCPLTVRVRDSNIKVEVNDGLTTEHLKIRLVDRRVDKIDGRIVETQCLTVRTSILVGSYGLGIACWQVNPCVVDVRVRCR